MKSIKFSLSLIVLLFLIGTLQAQNLQAYFNYSVFYDKETGPYLETYLSVMGYTARFIPVEAGYKADVDVTIILKDKGKVVDFKKLSLSSPVVADTTSGYPNFLDLQRFVLPEGIYNLELSIADANVNASPFTHSELITIGYNNEKVAFSGVELVDRYYTSEKSSVLAKNGYELIPYVANFYPENSDKLIYYTELYNTNKLLTPDEAYLLKIFVKHVDRNSVVDKLTWHKKKTPSEVEVVFGEFNISELYSGNFELIFQAINKDNEVFAEQKTFFQRSNPRVVNYISDYSSLNINSKFTEAYKSKDTLTAYIKSLRPIAANREFSFIDEGIKNANLLAMQQFLYAFWLNRDELNPENAWNKYWSQIKLIEEEYGASIMRGYETDRGRVYLKYGAPNEIIKKDSEPSVYPYEIWFYNHVQGQGKIKFLFYNPDVVGNNYLMVHTTARGETYTNNWTNVILKNPQEYTNEEKVMGTELFDLYNSH